ncbi:MAG TPA: hypothetical protein PLL69_08490, partial [Gemmatimonadales bacterium]|nr:hypothetical protein [Gemmatimonadales bacterium]
MTGPTPAAIPRFQKGTATYLSVGWPLLASLAFLAIGIVLGTRSGISTTTAASATVLMVLATLAGGAGAVALLRTPTAPPTAPFVALAAAVASLLALTPITGSSDDLPLVIFLLAGPWLYALTPLGVHFAMALGWPHRQRRWSGLVMGWYVLHAGLFLAAAGGIATGERPLVDTIDRLARQTALEPLGILTAIGALSLALASPVRRGAQRRAVGWGLAALALGLGPLLTSHVIPGLDFTFDGPVTFSRLALALVAFLGLTAVLALPLVNPVARDIQGHL